MTSLGLLAPWDSIHNNLAAWLVEQVLCFYGHCRLLKAIIAYWATLEAEKKLFKAWSKAIETHNCGASAVTVTLTASATIEIYRMHKSLLLHENSHFTNSSSIQGFIHTCSLTNSLPVYILSNMYATQLQSLVE